MKATEQSCSLAGFIAPKETGPPDQIGAFVLTSGIRIEQQFPPASDFFPAIRSARSSVTD
jgi:cobalamin-dependent methionine synthase I